MSREAKYARPSGATRVSRRKKVALLATAGLVLAAYAFISSLDRYEKAIYFPLSSWRGHGALQIRLNGDAMLFRHLSWEQNEKMNIPVYEDIGPIPPYPAKDDLSPILSIVPTDNTVNIVPGEVWDNAVSITSNCQSQTYEPSCRLQQASPYKLTFDGQQTKTAGKSVLQIAVSPSGKYVAVLSATGSPRKSFLPLIGGDSIGGRRYHQVFRASNGAPIGDPVRLKEANFKDNTIHPCWSPDERYIVYLYSRPDQLWIIPFPDAF